MRMSRWKRIVSLCLAIVLVAPTVLSLIPELSVTVNAVDLVDVGGMDASYAGNGLLVNGIYEIWLPDTGLVWQSSGDATKVFLGVGGAYSSWQSWVIEYGGSVQVRGSTSHWYTMYNGLLEQAVRQYDEEGNELPADQLDWESAPKAPSYQYKTEDGKLYYAQRFDAQGNEIPEDELVWQTDAVLLCWYYKTVGDVLYRAAQYDASGSLIAKDQLQWQPVGNTITSSAFHAREALTSTAVEPDPSKRPEAPQPPVETPQEDPAPTGWWARFLLWLWELLRTIMT